MHFTKMQGLGNDYLYVYGPAPGDVDALCVRLSDRHFGAGSDGMIFISPCEEADFSMRIFNADGSEAMMCGNGIRCVGKYVYDKGYTDKTHLRIDTKSGVRELDLHLRAGKVANATVAMGKAKAEEDVTVLVGDHAVIGTPVSVGNPHFVVFTQDVENVPLAALGPKLEKHPAFPGGVNVEFVQILGDNRLRMRVWERGSGVTLACGTGACASAAAAVAKGYCVADWAVAVELDGGILEIVVGSSGRVSMTGPAETVYEGEIEG